MKLTTVSLLALLAVPLAARAETHRVAVVAGNNAGDGSLAPLRYAEDDASKVARALLEVGQVREQDLFVLRGEPAAALETAIAKATARISELKARPDARTMLIFYFSGHSDGESIELGPDKLAFEDLKKLLARSGADVRVEIIDSCRSGAAVQPKGGKPVPAFTLRMADDLATSGFALMASSAADEVALESPELQGSYFTSALVSGLRGAADASGDKQVTLAEAYRYAYDHTVSSTAVTLEGAQHPTFDFKLSGQGELVLASLNRPQAGLVLPDGLDRALVIDVARDQVVAEMLPGASRFLALAPGNYAIRAFQRGKPLGTRVAIESGETREVHFGELERLTAPKVAMKGPAISQDLDTTTSTTTRPRVSLTVGAIGGGPATDLGARGALRLAVDPGLLEGLALIFEGGYGGTGGVTETAAHVRLGYQVPLHLTSALTLGLGGEAGASWFFQRVDGVEVGSGSGPALGPRASLRYALNSRTELEVEGGATFARVTLDTQDTWLALPEATAGLMVDF